MWAHLQCDVCISKMSSLLDKGLEGSDSKLPKITYLHLPILRIIVIWARGTAYAQLLSLKAKGLSVYVCVCVYVYVCVCVCRWAVHACAHTGVGEHMCTCMGGRGGY